MKISFFKKSIAAALSVLVMGGTLPAVQLAAPVMTSFAEEEYTEVTEGVLTYHAYSDHAEVADCNDDASGEIIIPAEINGVPVTAVGKMAFLFNKGITVVTLPDTVTSIGESAFYCSGLTSITLPASVESFGRQAFFLCSRLEKIVFENPDCAFPTDGYEDISSHGTGEGIFSYTGIIVGYEGSTAQEYAQQTGKVFEVIGSEGSQFVTDGAVTYRVTPDEAIVMKCDESAEGELIIPDKVGGVPVTEIEDDALSNRNITSVSLPDSVKKLGFQAFAYCENLASVKMPASLEEIGAYCFYFCDSLVSVELPASIARIGDSALSCCYKLETVTILNPDCEIYDYFGTIANLDAPSEYYYNGVIRGYTGSTAQAYAEKYGYKFESLGEYKTDEKQLGDLDGDGTIDASDASAILAEYAAIQTGAAPTVDLAVGDVNTDTALDATDASSILSYFAYTQTGGSGSLSDFLKTQ